MTDMSAALPAEDQWELLASHGFQKLFIGTWVEGDDPEEIAGLIGADPERRLECDLNTAMRWYQPVGGPEIVWIGAHSPGWTHITGISGVPTVVREAGSNGRRALQLLQDEDVMGLQDLELFVDSRLADDLGRFHEGPLEPGSFFEPYVQGLDLDPDADDEWMAHVFLCVLGRITGRFIDRDWFSLPGILCRLQERTAER